MPIAKVQLPDGRIGRFEVPEGTTPDQVLSFVSSGNIDKPAAPKPEGLLDPIVKPISNFTDKMYERGQKFANIADGANGYGQSLPETAWQAGTNIAGTAGNLLFGVPTEMATNIAGDMTPDWIKNPVKNAVAPIAETASNTWKKVKTEYPRAAANLEGVGDAFSVAPLASSGVRGATASAIDNVADVGGKAFKNVVKDTATGVGEGVDTFKSGLFARSGDDLAFQKKQMKADAGSIREDVKNRGVVISPQSSQNISAKIKEQLDGLEFIPELNPKTTIIVGKITAAAKDGITLNKLDQYRRLLRNAKDEDSVAASAVRRAIDDSVNGLQPTDLLKGDTATIDQLNQFRTQYTQASKFEDIADIVKKSRGDVSKLKSKLSSFLENDDNLRGWTPEEIKLANNAAEYSTTERILKGLGKFGYNDISQRVFLPMAASTAATASLGAPAAIGIGAAGTVSQQLYKVVGRGKTEKLLKRIEKNTGPVPRYYNGEVIPPSAGTPGTSVSPYVGPQGPIIDGAFTSSKKKIGKQNPALEQLPKNWLE